METKNEDKLRLDRIRLTAPLVEEIHLVQTGGMSDSTKVVDSHFDNNAVNDIINNLNELGDFIIVLYRDSHITDPKIIMDHLCHIHELKSHFGKFRV